MKPTEQRRFDALYEQHLRGLKLHGYSTSTIDVYSRAVRRRAGYYDCVPDQLSIEQLEIYFAALVDSHSWATVKVDRNSLQFFWKYLLKQDWQWLEIIKTPKIQSFTCNALRALWARHRHPRLLCPNAVGSAEHIRLATTPYESWRNTKSRQGHAR